MMRLPLAQAVALRVRTLAWQARAAGRGPATDLDFKFAVLRQAQAGHAGHGTSTPRATVGPGGEPLKRAIHYLQFFTLVTLLGNHNRGP